MLKKIKNVVLFVLVSIVMMAGIGAIASSEVYLFTDLQLMEAVEIGYVITSAVALVIVVVKGIMSFARTYEGDLYDNISFKGYVTYITKMMFKIAGWTLILGIIIWRVLGIWYELDLETALVAGLAIAAGANIFAWTITAIVEYYEMFVKELSSLAK